MISLLAAAALAVPAAHARVVVGESCPGERAVGAPGLAYAAVAEGRVLARTAPRGKRVRTFGRWNQNGVRTVFSVASVVVGRSCEPHG